MSKFDVDDVLVRKLAKLLQETGLTEIEYENNGQRIRVNSSISTSAPAVPVTPIAAVAATSAPAKSDQPAAGTLNSPMVGTAYLAPEPNAAPFVKVGDRVSKGQTVLIIEAMKVMNPIQAPNAGTVTEVHIQDGQPVEFGEPLLVIQ
ncbi:acetyl-CoA carboxylase biotin carboxyl carrier protein [Dongia soli]|uniref:Biotin carboxyl carrier protein of acetyl-CoA carboxylase n=1 Tax=Dongia soli TaxID=600628 RepID=A0ABU5ECF4_9PROT|nr:acetyl-CoA carboxylase biotin carboxyl carrier protein [Dongia soli]MDY0883710.1 acetyl-CoA carboxylase biotin carboxyl carrier protein [Dongia soli]